MKKYILTQQVAEKKLQRLAYEILENKILPMYYNDHDKWRQITQNGMKDVRVQFDSNRMVREYYELLYKS